MEYWNIVPKALLRRNNDTGCKFGTIKIFISIILTDKYEAQFS